MTCEREILLYEWGEVTKYGQQHKMRCAGFVLLGTFYAKVAA